MDCVLGFRVLEDVWYRAGDWYKCLYFIFLGVDRQEDFEIFKYVKDFRFCMESKNIRN